MIYVHIKKELAKFETDIRDLCLAFFPLQNLNLGTGYIIAKKGTPFNNKKNLNLGTGYIIAKKGTPFENDIIVKDYYTGPLTGDRLTIKSELKRQLYNHLSKLTGKTLLWGTLTGIRPVTIATKFFDLNLGTGYIIDKKGTPFGARIARAYRLYGRAMRAPVSLGTPFENAKNDKLNIKNAVCDELIKKELKKEYYISDEKADELIEIAKNEVQILNRNEIKDYKDMYSVYVGVPFCKSTCLYCSFTSFNIEKFGKYVDDYLETLEKDFATRIEKIRESENKGCPQISNNIPRPQIQKLQPLTLYIGGGTPTSLDETAFEKMLTIIDKYVDRSKCVEYTVEAGRPDTITKEKLLIMKRHGVTRISINPQTFNQKTLDLIGRKHTVKDVVEKFKLARSLGFDNINMDIILGLPNEHLFQVLKTLNGIRKLKPDSFTVHSLALKRAARLNFELDSWTKNYYLAGLGNRMMAKCYIPEGKREIDKMFKWSRRLADFLHLQPYYLYRQKNMAGNLENVGYAKLGKECVYNIMMMSERHTVYGFGTATTKKIFYENDGSKRIESEEGYKSVIDYCKSFETI